MIITNNHVVTNEYTNEAVSDITVTLTTGEELPATIVGRDPLTDLAVIKVNSVKPLPAATFVTDMPKVGEYAVAIGSPLGFSNSVTLGIVSALDRTLDVTSYTGEVVTYFGLIQTDTPISPGNSGGALANASGQVIGINAVKSDQSGAEGIGFAIPSSIVTKVADEIIKHRQGHPRLHGSGHPDRHRGSADAVQPVALLGHPHRLRSRRTGPPPRPASSGATSSSRSTAKTWSSRATCCRPSATSSRAIRSNVTLDRNGQTMDVTVTLEERPAELSSARPPGSAPQSVRHTRPGLGQSGGEASASSSGR